MNHLNYDTLQTAYGEPQDALKKRTLRTLAALPDESPAHWHHGRRKTLLLAFALGILVLGTALAITLRSEFTQRLGLPEAVDVLAMTPDPATSSAVTDMAVFTIDSYLFDGISLMADVRVEPNRSDIWILPDWYEQYLDYPASNDFGVDIVDQSIREYAASLGIREIRFVQITGAATGEDASRLWIKADPYLGSDGFIHFLLTSSMFDSFRPELDLSIRFYVLFSAQPREDTVTLHLTAETEPDTQRTPLETEVLGVTIQRIDIIHTPVVAYYRMTYTCDPEVGQRVAAVPLFLDSEDQLIMTHLWQSGSFSNETRTGVFNGVLPPSAEKDGQFSFRLLVNGQRSEPITVIMPASKQ